MLKSFFQIHWFLGITAGLILSLDGCDRRDLFIRTTNSKMDQSGQLYRSSSGFSKTSPAEIYQHFHTHSPNLKINSITVASAADESSVINVVKEGQRRGLNMMINPYTAEMLPEIKDVNFLAFIQQLHRNLTVGPVGKQITGACALMIFFVLSGLYLRWPKIHTWKYGSQ